MLLRAALKTLIALFCVWHMAAVGIYSLYGVDKYPVLAWLDTKRSYVRPYVLVTSQWQRWNLFSPDPLRRVIEMEIDILKNGEWETVKTVNGSTVSFWRRATELKTLRRMEDDSMTKMQERYLHVHCHEKGLPTGTSMRLRKRWFVIPKHEKTLSEEWWNTWQPEWHDNVLTETDCPVTL